MKEKLQKRYGFFVASSMVVGIVIGIGIFFKAKDVLAAAGLNPKVAIAAWVIGGIITILSGLSAAELGAAIPETGGMIAWIKKIYGDRLGFVVGWTYMILYFPALIAMIGYFFALFAANLFGISPEHTHLFIILLSFFAITFIFIMNVITSKLAGRIQAVTTVIKLIPLILILIFGLLSHNNIQGTFFTSPSVVNMHSSFMILLGTALVPVMFAFDGWIIVGTISGDLKNVTKDLPRAIIFGLGFIVLLYILLNIGLLEVFPAHELAKKGLMGAVAFLFGAYGSKLIYVGIVISAFGVLNGIILASTRVPYALAIENTLPKKDFFAKVSDRHKQPINSSITMFILTMIYFVLMFITKQYGVFGDVPVAIFWLFYSLLFLGVFILRKKDPDLVRPYKVPFYPLVPLIAFLGGVVIFISALYAHPIYMVISLVLALLGFIVYQNPAKNK